MAQDLNYRTYGRPSDIALLLIHPLGTDLRFWDECVAQWAPRFFCIAPDLRNAGLSPLADPPVEVAGHAADLERLRAELGVASVVPIGCALGGMVAISYAATHPDRCKALIVTNPGLRTAEPAKAVLRERAAQVRASGMASLLPGAMDRAFHNMPQDERYRRYEERYRAQDAERYARSALGFIDADITATVARVSCPTLLVRGDSDLLMAAEDGPAMQKAMARAEFTVMTGAAHFLPFQAPDRFAPLAIAYLDRVMGESALRQKA